jgi:hypothetical protein
LFLQKVLNNDISIEIIEKAIVNLSFPEGMINLEKVKEKFFEKCLNLNIIKSNLNLSDEENNENKLYIKGVIIEKLFQNSINIYFIKIQKNQLI